jgi:hypothetical protein
LVKDGFVIGFVLLVLFLAHRHAQQHIAAGSAPARAIPRPRRRERRLDLINSKRVGEELDAEGDIPEAAAQIWTDSVLALLRTPGLVRRWFQRLKLRTF